MRKKTVITRRLFFLGLAAVLTATPARAVENQSLPEEPGRSERHDWRWVDERPRILARVRINGLVEVEAFHRNGYADTADKEQEGDIELATVALDFHAQLSAWARAHVLLLWEEGETEPIEVDEAVISLGNPEKFPLFLNAGRMYVPFGVYHSFMIQCPLTKKLGETSATAVQIGFSATGFYGSAYAFKAEARKAGSDDTINTFGTNLGYRVKTKGWSLDAGVGYLNNLAASALISDTLAAAGSLEINERIGSLKGYLHLKHGPSTFYAEYLAAADSFAAAELGAAAVKPKAWHLEAAYTRELLAREITFALGYQGTDQAVDLDLPEQRYLTAINVALTDHLSWAVEYIHDRDYSMNKGGTGGKADQLTTQLAFAF